MNAQQTYIKYVKKEITESDFAYQMRRNPMLKEYISPVSTVSDIISILKSKGIIWEQTDENKEPKKAFDAFEAFQQNVVVGTILEGNTMDKWILPPKAEKNPSESRKKRKTANDVNYYEFTHGWKHEYLTRPELMKDQNIEKAKEIALKNLTKDPMYYSTLLYGDTFKKTEADAEYNVTKLLKQKSKAEHGSLKDKKNGMKQVKDQTVDKTNVSGGLKKSYIAKGQPQKSKFNKKHEDSPMAVPAGSGHPIKESLKAEIRKLLNESEEYKKYLDSAKKKVKEELSKDLKPRVYPNDNPESLSKLKAQPGQIMKFNQGFGTHHPVVFLVNPDIKSEYSKALQRYKQTTQSKGSAPYIGKELKGIAKYYRMNREIIIDLRGFDQKKIEKLFAGLPSKDKSENVQGAKTKDLVGQFKDMQKALAKPIKEGDELTIRNVRIGDLVRHKGTNAIFKVITIEPHKGIKVVVQQASDTDNSRVKPGEDKLIKGKEFYVPYDQIPMRLTKVEKSDVKGEPHVPLKGDKNTFSANEEFPDNTAPEKADEPEGLELEDKKLEKKFSKSQIHQGKMHQILGVSAGEKIEEKYPTGEKLYKALVSKTKDHGKAMKMIAYAANISKEKDIFDAALRYGQENNHGEKPNG